MLRKLRMPRCAWGILHVHRIAKSPPSVGGYPWETRRAAPGADEPARKRPVTAGKGTIMEEFYEYLSDGGFAISSISNSSGPLVVARGREWFGVRRFVEIYMDLNKSPHDPTAYEEAVGGEGWPARPENWKQWEPWGGNPPKAPETEPETEERSYWCPLCGADDCRTLEGGDCFIESRLG